ncbi:MAG: hypothetical protein RL681_153 [Candidatus Parcubacteria bacterium]
MNLHEHIVQDAATAQKAGDAVRLGTLRLLIAAAQNRAIEKRAGNSDVKLSDDDMLELLRREAKKRREAIELYAKGGRDDLRTKEEAELAIIAGYLPAEMSRADVIVVVKRLAGAGSQEFSSLMKAAMAELKGKADGRVVSDVVKEVLS